jgi:hypothetical protein
VGTRLWGQFMGTTRQAPLLLPTLDVRQNVCSCCSLLSVPLNVRDSLFTTCGVCLCVVVVASFRPTEVRQQDRFKIRKHVQPKVASKLHRYNCKHVNAVKLLRAVTIASTESRAYRVCIDSQLLAVVCIGISCTGTRTRRTSSRLALRQSTTFALRLDGLLAVSRRARAALALGLLLGRLNHCVRLLACSTLALRLLLGSGWLTLGRSLIISGVLLTSVSGAECLNDRSVLLMSSRQLGIELYRKAGKKDCIS